MIYALGLDSDPTFRYFVAQAAARQEPVTVINLRSVALNGAWRFALPDDGESYLAVSERRFILDPTAPYLVRMINLASVQAEPVLAYRWSNLLNGLSAWLEHIPGLVINRPGGHVDNFTKPLHEHALQGHGFTVPASLTSSDPVQLTAFAQAGPAIIKSVAAARVASRLVRPDEFLSFRPAQGPIHLQRYIAGADIRAHVLGNRVHADLVTPVAATGRFVPTMEVTATPHDLPADLVAQLVRATAAFGLTFAGWDFKLADGAYWCLEANPMPGYDGQDYRLRRAITTALLDLLHSHTA